MAVAALDRDLADPALRARVPCRGGCARRRPDGRVVAVVGAVRLAVPLRPRGVEDPAGTVGARTGDQPDECEEAEDGSRARPPRTHEDAHGAHASSGFSGTVIASRSTLGGTSVAGRGGAVVASGMFGWSSGTGWVL